MHIRRAHAENQIDLAYDLLLQLPAQYNNITLSVLEPAVFSLVGRTLLDSKEPEKFVLYSSLSSSVMGCDERCAANTCVPFSSN
jgi:hypothetical protein